MLAWFAFTLGLFSVPEHSASETVECFGPFVGFEAGSARFSAGTRQSLQGLLDHMNNPLWRNGWFVFHFTARNPTGGSEVALVRRRQATVVRELTRRGIARQRIRFAPVETFDPSYHDENASYIMSTVPRRVWDRIVSPGLVC